MVRPGGRGGGATALRCPTLATADIRGGADAKDRPELPGIEPGSYPFSKVVEANGFVFLAGQVGDVPGSHGAVPGRHRAGDPRDARQRRARCSKPSASTTRDVVKATVYCK